MEAGQSTVVIEVIKRDLSIYSFFFYFGGIFFPDFRSNKSKSGSSIVIAYPRPKLGYESGVVTMNLRGSGG